MKNIIMSIFACFALSNAYGSLPNKTAIMAGHPAAAGVKTVAKPAIPAVGKPYTIAQLFALINTSNPAQTSNFILPTLGGKVVSHDHCWPSRGLYVDGSVSAGHVNFGGVIINQQWVAANAHLQVQLQADPGLIAFLIRDHRLQKAGRTDEQYAQILLYFVLAINGVNYRFYLNDVCPGRIQGAVYPARSIASKWDFQRSYNP